MRRCVQEKKRQCPFILIRKMSTEVDWESSSLGHISTFIVKRRPLVAVVIITTAKEEVRMNSRLIRRRGGGQICRELFTHVFFLLLLLNLYLFREGQLRASSLLQ